MNILFVKSTDDVFRFGAKLKQIFNISNENPTNSQKVQFRESTNKGGNYWLLETLGIEVEIILNEDEEVFFEEMAEFPFYITINIPLSNDNNIADVFLKHIKEILVRNGYE